MHYYWNWALFGNPAPNGAETYFDTLASGLCHTLIIAALGWLIAILTGTIAGMLRTMPNKMLARAVGFYIAVLSNVPLPLQMFLWYFVLPELLPAETGALIKSLPNAALVAGILCLGMFTSARIATQVAAGIQFIPYNQTLACRALGLTRLQTYRLVLLPMAFRIIGPGLTSEAATIIKNSAVALTAGLLEMTASLESLSQVSLQILEAYTAALLIYLLVSMMASATASLTGIRPTHL